MANTSDVLVIMGNMDIEAGKLSTVAQKISNSILNYPYSRNFIDSGYNVLTESYYLNAVASELSQELPSGYSIVVSSVRQADVILGLEHNYGNIFQSNGVVVPF